MKWKCSETSLKIAKKAVNLQEFLPGQAPLFVLLVLVCLWMFHHEGKLIIKATRDIEKLFTYHQSHFSLSSVNRSCRGADRESKVSTYTSVIMWIIDLFSSVLWWSLIPNWRWEVELPHSRARVSISPGMPLEPACPFRPGRPSLPGVPLRPGSPSRPSRPSRPGSPFSLFSCLSLCCLLKVKNKT